MKRHLILFLVALLSVVTAFAQNNGSGFIGNGYYRVKNKATNRYIYVTDNKDYYDITHDKEDFQALQLWKDAEKACTDPASIIYMENISGQQYDLLAQGTGVHMLTGYYITADKKFDGCYEVFAKKSGVTKYLSDNEKSNAQQGQLGTGGAGNYRRWIVDMIDPNDETNYIGIKPTIELNGKFYQPYYVSFPFKACSPDMHVYYIQEIQGNIAYLKEIKGEIPGATPVFIECASADPSQNRIEPLISTSAKVTGNKLSGIYFCNGNRPQKSVDAYKIFDAATMRIFSVVNGGIVLTNNAPERLNEIKVNDYVNMTGKIKIQCLYANTSYLLADSSTPEVLEISFDEPVSGKEGDLNGDNKVDIADAVTVLNLMSDGSYTKAADVNGDNKVDIADFVTILNIMAQGDEGIKGDLNGDKKVDIADAVTVLNIMATGGYTKIADVNGDQKVDIADFVTILNIMATQ